MNVYEFFKSVFVTAIVWVLLSWIINDLTVGLLHTQQLADVSCGTMAGEILIAMKSIIVFCLFQRLVWPHIKAGWPPLRETLLEILSF